MPESFSQRLQRAWYAPRAPWLLRPLSWLYGAVVELRRIAYRLGLLPSRHPGVPVIVTGNLTVGGTGKTPVTLWLARQLAARGLQVGIVSRGYGGSAREARVVTAGSDPREVGDEALLLARHSGAQVCVARRRVQAAEVLAARGCRIILSDDGLQHLAMRRDLEIAVVDGARGFGNCALLPAGPLRESLRRLRSVDFVLVNGAGQPYGMPADLQPLHFTLQPGPALPLRGGAGRALEGFRGEPVHAVAGIGHPARFFAELRAAGLSIIEHAFPDHHAFQAADLAFGDGRAVLMTQKDAVKCAAFAAANLWYVPVEVEMAPAAANRVISAAMRAGSAGG